MTRFVSYAQNCEDVILWRALGHIENGFFVDCGAYDPTHHSVTKAFYDRGWRGINIEPLPSLVQRFVDERPSDINLNIALSDRSGYASFYEIADTGLSTFNPQFARTHVQCGFVAKSMKVQTTDLSRVLDRFSRDAIHFLKIDVEGAEKLVLAGLDLQKFRPWIILVEATKPLSAEPSYQDWEFDLLSRGYHFAYFDGLNRFYVSQEHPELRLPLSVPPNIFDNFVQMEQLNALAQLQDQLTALKSSASWRLTAPLREVKRSLQTLHYSIRSLAVDLTKRLNSWRKRPSTSVALGNPSKHVSGLAPTA
jgi:FkbM family methyltransferase